MSYTKFGRRYHPLVIVNQQLQAVFALVSCPAASLSSTVVDINRLDDLPKQRKFSYGHSNAEHSVHIRGSNIVKIIIAIEDKSAVEFAKCALPMSDHDTLA